MKNQEKKIKCLKKFLCFKWYEHDYQAYDRYEKVLYDSESGGYHYRKYQVFEKEKCLICKHKKEIYMETRLETSIYH